MKPRQKEASFVLNDKKKRERERRKLTLYCERGLVGFYNEKEEFVLIHVIFSSIETGDDLN